MATKGEKQIDIITLIVLSIAVIVYRFTFLNFYLLEDSFFMRE